MNRTFREYNLKNVFVDEDSTPAKHDSIPMRQGRTGWEAKERKRFINSRRLESWLISDWQHKRRQMKMPNLDFEPVRSGLYYSLRLGGTWVAADWWLQYFEINSVQTTALRLEYLESDLNKHIYPLLPENTKPFKINHQENAKPLEFKKDEPKFTNDDLKRIRSNNPRWAEWDLENYGPINL